MAKNYVVTLIVLLFFAFATEGFAQEIAQPQIENLSIYPNPVNSNRQFIFITSKHNLVKQIEFFNAIGKKIYATTLTGKELNISRLATGVYFLKITENNITETRKLVIK